MGTALADGLASVITEWLDNAHITAGHNVLAAAFMSGYLAAARELTGEFVTARWANDVAAAAPGALEIVKSRCCEPVLLRVGEYEYDDDFQDGVIPAPI